MWQHMSFFSAKETSFGENLFKLQLGSKLSTLFFLSLVFIPRHNFWLSSIRYRKLFFSSRGWCTHLKYLPKLGANSSLFFKYFEKKSAKPMFRDGETTVFSLAYTHRKLRLNELFWCQPRCFRVESSILILLRANSVLQKKLRIKRTRSTKINIALKTFFSQYKEYNSGIAGELAWF